MRTHRLATVLELTAKILREFPDDELPVVLEDLLDKLQKGKKQKSRNYQINIETGISQEMIERLMAMSPNEIEQYISTSEEFKTANRLRELANRLGIKTSQRQNYAAILNMIIRNFEARHMDSIIRRGKDNE